MKSPVPPYLHAGDIYGAMLLHWADEFATLAERYRVALVRKEG